MKGRIFGVPNRMLPRVVKPGDVIGYLKDEVAELVGLTISAISHQLQSLRLMNLVKFRKVGKEVYYSLADDHVKAILDIGFEHIFEDK